MNNIYFDVDKEMEWYFLGEKGGKKRAGGFHKGKKVNKLTMDGKYLKTYISIGSAANEIGIDGCQIRKAALGIVKHARGFRWEFA